MSSARLLTRTFGIGALSLLCVGLDATMPSKAEAFCGFYVAPGDQPLYNEASMVVLMREDTRTVLSMSNQYKGPAKDFAMVVPVPVVLTKENVKTLNKDIFAKLEALTAPRLVEYWEQDPCPAPVREREDDARRGPRPPAPMSASKPAAKTASDYGVTIEAKFAVGEYEILVLSAKESDGLERWLVDNKYNIPSGASAALAPYIKEQMKFFVAKVDVKKINVDASGVAQLSPLRFSYESADFRLPVRLGLLNAKGKQDLIIFTLSKTKRYDAANYANVMIPTNLEVSDDTRKSFNAFYAGLFDEAIEKGGRKAVVTEYSWMSNSCDPCPTPPLDGNAIATLGGDVLFGMVPPAPTPPPGTPSPGPMPAGKPMSPSPPMGPMGRGKPGGGFFGSVTPMVLTRLHARYDQSSLTEDIVFHAADPIVGGREISTDGKGTLEKGALPSGMNNFQARYVIRHPWTGPIKCLNPVRNVWGGPPGGGSAHTAPATNLSHAPRGGIKLASFFKKGMPDFDVRAAPGIPPPPPGPLATIDPPEAGPPVEDAGTTDDSSVSGAASGVTTPPGTRGCGCDIPSTGGTRKVLTGIFVGALALTGLVARRRKRSIHSSNE